jgi:hypothetical protein
VPQELSYILATRDPEQPPPLSLGLMRPSPIQVLIGGLSLPNGEPPDWDKLERAWKWLQNGDFEPTAKCWPGWLGVQTILESWRSDYGIWQAQDLARNRLALEAWCLGILNGEESSARGWPCSVIPEWIEDQVWVSLLPAPGFGPGAYPALVDFGAPLSTTGKRLRGNIEVLLLEADPQHPALWAPLNLEVRNSLLHQAHLQRAAFQRL